MSEYSAQKRSNSESARPLDPNVLQRQAASPVDSIWVGASAGSGKTKVLTDRVLRLLLPGEDGKSGTKPHKILCLTFTKAGANEMSLRLSRRLSEWTIWPQQKLEEDLRKLLGRAPHNTELSAARKLFADVIDAPGGLNILTIHAFCQSVLGRFPLEAGLPPHFEVLEDNESSILLRTAFANVLREVQPGTPLQQALDNLAGELNEEQLFTLIHDMARERRQLAAIFKRYWDENGLYTALCQYLDVPPGQNPEDLIYGGCVNSAFDHAGLLSAAEALAQGSAKTDRPKGQTLSTWLKSTQEARLAQWEDYKQIFLKKTDGEILKTLATATVLKANPALLDILQTEAARLQALIERYKCALCAAQTRDLMLLGKAVTDQYQILKELRGTLDFDDLIMRTLGLLQSMAPWVLFKLDQGLDHVLIDEAQDTNPEQWQIIAALCDEFYTGIGAKDDQIRTIFTVGDIKQSIYSFQRAAPEEFSRMKAYFEQKIRDSGQIFAEIPMNISFRSTKSVLQAVDSVFLQAETMRGMGDNAVSHVSFREGQEGLVELYPLFETPDSADRDPWDPPVSVVESHNGAAALAEHIGDQVAGWLAGKEFLPARGRPVRPDDILILLRTRTRFFAQIVRALKRRNIPVSGVDRMVLREQMAVQDLMAAAQFALLPEDDLNLAGLLKSPLLGWTEEQLFNLAYPRGKGTSLWQALQVQNNETSIYLKSLIERSGRATPYAFLTAILFSPCPANAYSGMQAMRARLGDDAQDPIDELLNAALTFESMHVPSLQNFVHWHIQGDSDIKREMDEAGGKVRIMTVHGAKGLQAPIVLMPDTTRTQRHHAAKADSRLLWPEKTGLSIPLWSPRKESACVLFTQTLNNLQNRLDDEYRRLLYVAMTRTEDRLYVYGYQGKKAALADSWYHFIAAGLYACPEIKKRENSTLRLYNPQVKAPDRIENNIKELAQDTRLPDWSTRAAPDEPTPPRPLIPSRPSQAEPSVFSPLTEENTYRFLRGNLTHKLLQFLPALPVENQRQAAQKFLDQNGQNLKDEIKQGIIDEILAIFIQKDFAPLFGPASRAEVPVTGLMPDGRIMSGQIDRLLITPSSIFIIDYKTNRPPPKLEKDIPAIYRAQMQAYADALKMIYPGRAIHAALLWTDGPTLMPVKLEP